MRQLVECICSVFPNFDRRQATPDAQLGTIPDWDSMASVNLQMELEAVFLVQLEDSPLTADQSLLGLVELLRAKGAQLDES